MDKENDGEIEASVDDATPKTRKSTQSKSRKAKVLTPVQEDEDVDVVSSTQKLSTSSRRTSTHISSSSVTSCDRVTRSRSRSLMRETRASAPASILPRLDIQSEDEDEVDQSLIYQPQSPKLQNWSKIMSPKIVIPKEARTIVAVSLVLLVLLLIATKAVDSLNSDRNMNDAVIMVLAYLLTPIRLTVDCVRLVLGVSHGQFGQHQAIKSAQVIDYDLIVENILKSDKLKTIIEQISNEKVYSFGQQIEAKLKSDPNDFLKSELKQLEEEVIRTKLEVHNQIDNVLYKVNSDNSLYTENNKEQNEKMIDFDKKLENLKQEIKLVGQTVMNSDNSVYNEKIHTELDMLKEKLKSLEDNRLAIESEIKKCCGNNKDVTLVIENKVSNVMAQLRQSLDTNFVTQEELNSRISDVENQMRQKLSMISEKSIKETKTSVEEIIQYKFNEIHSKIDSEHIPSVVKNNVNISSTEDMVTNSVDVSKIVQEALTKYDADKTGLFDFALETAGGSILTTKCTEPYQMTSAVLSVWGIPFWWDNNSPRTILQPGTSPGQCWAFRGSHGVVVVQLSAKIHITAVTIEHISNLLSPDGNIYSAPSHMSLSGVGADSETVTSLLNFTYSATGDPVQTFYLSEAETRERWHVVELSIDNNHGHPEYTCLYRLRVHGKVSQEETGRKH